MIEGLPVKEKEGKGERLRKSNKIGGKEKEIKEGGEEEESLEYRDGHSEISFHSLPPSLPPSTSPSSPPSLSLSLPSPSSPLDTQSSRPSNLRDTSWVSLLSLRLTPPATQPAPPSLSLSFSPPLSRPALTVTSFPGPRPSPGLLSPRLLHLARSCPAGGSG